MAVYSWSYSPTYLRAVGFHASLAGVGWDQNGQGLYWEASVCSCVWNPPKTLNLEPQTLDPKLGTLNPKP